MSTSEYPVALSANTGSVQDKSNAEHIGSNTLAFAHNATFPPSDDPLKAQQVLPELCVRKPSGSGLHLQTDVVAPGISAEATRAYASLSHTRHVPAPLQGLVARRSWDSNAGSPSSTASSPAFGALGDVTPLPSPIGPIHSDVWSKVAGRPTANSGGNVEREKSAALLAPSSISPLRRKKYGDLSGAPLDLSAEESTGAADRIRALSEFVPDTLQNVRPRIVTGPSAASPPKLKEEAPQAQPSTPLHRELFYAKHKRSQSSNLFPIPASLHDTASSLPSPPPSNRSLDDENDDTFKLSSDFLSVKDSVTNQLTNWKQVRVLGNGSFSEVILATNNLNSGPNDTGAWETSSASHQLVAIKIVSHDSENDEERMDTSIKREIEILQSIHHPCLPQLYAFEDNETNALLVLNYCPGGDLFDFASQYRELLTPKLIQRIFAELVAAVSYLHAAFIVHRDIKLENILLNMTSTALPLEPSQHPTPLITLTDLGLSKHIPKPPDSPLLTHPCGSVDYAAPEVLLGQAYDGRATDAWALGVVLYALMEGRLPFDPVPRGKRRGTNNVKHRIARCDWLWCEYGDDYGDWIDSAPQAAEMQGAREVVEGLLKKVGRGRWPLERVVDTEWLEGGIKVEGGLRIF